MGILLWGPLVASGLAEVIERPLEVWWGPYRGSGQLVDAGADQWRFVQEEMDGYLLHGAYWNYATSVPSPDVLGPKLAAIVNAEGKPVMLEHLLAGLYPDIDSAFGYAFAGTVNDGAGYGSAIANIRRLTGYGFPVPDVSTDYIVNSWEEAVRWHPEWTGEEFFTARSGNWETYAGTQFDAAPGSPDRQRYGWFRQWVERLADAFPGIRVTATNSPVYFSWEAEGLVRRELGGSFNNFYTWLKLERRGAEVRALYSGEGGGWEELGRADVPLGAVARAGLLVASGTPALAEGRFDNVRQIPFFMTDIGRPGRSGRVEAAGGIFTLEANGDHGLHPGNNRTDAQYFAYREWSGDGTFTARLYNLSGSNPNRTNPNAETPTAGITLRSTTEASSRQVSLHANLANQLEFLARPTDFAGLAHVAGSGSPVANAGAAGGPRWLRLERSGNTITASHSPDGVSWTVLGSVTVNLGTTFRVGLAADSQVSFERATAGFTHVSFLDSPSASFSGATIGAAGPATSSLSGTSASLRSGGTGIAGTADAMRFHSTAMDGDGTLVARLQYFANGLTPEQPLPAGAQMGLALRAGTGAGDPQFAALFTPENGLKALVRTATGGAVGLAGAYGEGECGIEPLGAQYRPLLHYFTGNDYLRTLHEAFPGGYRDNFAGFTTDSPYAGYQKWGGSETHPDAIRHREKIILYERWLQANGREHHFIANSAGGTDFNGFNTSTQAGRDAWDALYKEQSLRSFQLHQLEGGRPDKVIFESWYAGPFSLVPESREGTFTNLVREGILYLKGIGQVLDLAIAPSAGEPFSGLDVQQIHPWGVQRVATSPGSVPTVREWTVRLTNNGSVGALPVLHAHQQAASGWTINYRLNGLDITAGITSPSGVVVTDSQVRGEELLAPGAFVDLVLTLTQTQSGPPEEGSILVRAFWNPQDPNLAHRDAIRIDLREDDPYLDWVSAFDWQDHDSSPTADPDGDGMANLVEYALSGNPLAYEKGKAPQAGISASRLTLSFDRKADPALHYNVLGSNDLIHWSSIWTSHGEGNTEEHLMIEDTTGLQSNQRRFMKLTITRD